MELAYREERCITERGAATRDTKGITGSRPASIPHSSREPTRDQNPIKEVLVAAGKPQDRQSPRYLLLIFLRSSVVWNAVAPERSGLGCSCPIASDPSHPLRACREASAGMQRTSLQ